MNFAKLILVTAIIMVGCSNKEKKNEALEFEEATDSTRLHRAIRQNESDTFAQSSQKGYEKSMIYRDGNSDSLLIEIGEVKRLLEVFKKKGKEVKKKEYGAGDYFGVYKIYTFNSDTLVINKGDAGEYGFNNSQYLIKKDSLVFVREYNLLSIYGSGRDSIVEEITRFRNNSMVLARRTKGIRKLKNLYLGTAKFDTIKGDPNKKYKALQQQLRHIYTLELMN